MGNPELSSKTEIQKMWENEPRNVEKTLAYLDELCLEGEVSSAKKVLEDVWKKLKSDEGFLNSLVMETKYLPLIAHVQFLIWRDDPSDLDNGLDVVQGFLIEGSQEKAEDAVDIMFDVIDFPMNLLEKVQQDLRMESLRVFCEQRAVQYQARNSLKKKMAKKKNVEKEVKKETPKETENKIEDLGKGYTRDEKYVYHNGKNLLGADIENFDILDGGYSTDNTWLFFENKRTTFSFNVKKNIFDLGEKGIITLDDEIVLENGKIFKPKVEEKKKEKEDLGQGYTRDVKCVYYKDKNIFGARLENFEILGGGYSTDNECLFYENKKLFFKFSTQDDFSFSEHGVMLLKEKGVIYFKGQQIKDSIRDIDIEELRNSLDSISSLEDLALFFSKTLHGLNEIILRNSIFDVFLDKIFNNKENLQKLVDNDVLRISAVSAALDKNKNVDVNKIFPLMLPSIKRDSFFGRNNSIMKNLNYENKSLFIREFGLDRLFVSSDSVKINSQMITESFIWANNEPIKQGYFDPCVSNAHFLIDRIYDFDNLTEESFLLILKNYNSINNKFSDYRYQNRDARNILKNLKKIENVSGKVFNYKPLSSAGEKDHGVWRGLSLELQEDEKSVLIRCLEEANKLNIIKRYFSKKV